MPRQLRVQRFELSSLHLQSFLFVIPDIHAWPNACVIELLITLPKVNACYPYWYINSKIGYKPMIFTHLYQHIMPYWLRTKRVDFLHRVRWFLVEPVTYAWRRTRPIGRGRRTLRPPCFGTWLSPAKCLLANRCLTLSTDLRIQSL